MFARTPRLLLRPGWQEDAKALQEAMADEGIVRNLARAPWPYRLSDAESFLSLPIDPRHPRLLIFSRTQGSPRLVGGCGLAPDRDESAELGYWIARPYWGLGFATEAVSALVSAARTVGHRHLRARHAVDNPASARVLRKIGFRPTGDFVRVHSTARGEEVLTALFEDAGEAEMRGDAFVEFYDDAAFMAA
jgi:RimJ/RimL family protein N-acetyltransferase